MHQGIQKYERLYEYNPNLRLIYIVRNPVERVISNYSHRLVRGTEREQPEPAVFTDPTYINRSRYGVQIRPYLKLFPKNNILIIIFEDFISAQSKVLNQIANFLDISSFEYQNNTTLPKHSSVREWHLKRPINSIINSRIGRALFPIIPKRFRNTIRPLLSNRLEQKPYFSMNLRRSIWEFLEDDVRYMESYLGRTLDAWRYDYSD